MNDTTEPITDGLPDGVPLVASFEHEYNKLSWYYPRLVGCDGVSVPETQFFEVSESNGMPQFDDHAVAHWMREHGYQRAFVRGDYSSAKVHPREGSLIYEPVSDVVRDTVANLIRDLITQDRSLGGKIAVRELLDLDYCPRQNNVHFHHNEVRYIVRDGSVRYCLDSVDEWIQSHESCDNTYEYVVDDLDDIEFPDEQAQCVARAFDEYAWSVDFARDAKSGTWYCIDMGLDGLYWEDTIEEWCTISGYGDRDEWCPERHADQMPHYDEL